MHCRAGRSNGYRWRISKANLHRWGRHSLLHPLRLCSLGTLRRQGWIYHRRLLDTVGQRWWFPWWSYRLLRQLWNRHLHVGLQSFHLLQQGRILARRILSGRRVFISNFLSKCLLREVLCLNFFLNKICLSMNFKRKKFLVPIFSHSIAARSKIYCRGQEREQNEHLSKTIFFLQQLPVAIIGSLFRLLRAMWSSFGMLFLMESPRWCIYDNK